MGGCVARGAALIDVVFATSLMAVLAAIAIPMWQSTRQHHEARVSARYVAARFQHARMEAVKRNVMVSVRIDPESLNEFVLYADGDGDGVLQTDIDGGIDIPIGVEARFSDHLGAFALRVNQDVSDPETGQAIARGSDPLRIGRTALVSFSPLGSTTSGTLYWASPTGGCASSGSIPRPGSGARIKRYRTATDRSRDAGAHAMAFGRYPAARTRSHRDQHEPRRCATALEQSHGPRYAYRTAVIGKTPADDPVSNRALSRNGHQSGSLRGCTGVRASARLVARRDGVAGRKFPEPSNVAGSNYPLLATSPNVSGCVTRQTCKRAKASGWHRAW
jgi:type II secretion system GspH-like protein